ncbi:hypothetical protein CR513_14773, partial [Mucuna pruriens]
MFFLQEFDIEIKDKSGVENLVVDHLSRIEGRIDPVPIRDDFTDEQLMQLDGNTPWFADIVNYLVASILPPEASRSYKDKIKSDAKYYVWDDPYLFGVPKALISDQGSHFYNKTMSTLLEKYRVVNRVATSYHPQTNGQAERKVAHPSRKDWSWLIEDALWDHKTTYRTLLRMSPYWIVFGKACHLPVEIEHRAYWVVKRKLQLQELEELHLEAYEKSKIYKENVKRFHDNMILRKEFKVQEVLLFNYSLKLITSKLCSKWDGPFVIINVIPYSVVEIRNEATNKTFKVNGHQLKLFHECPTMMDGDVEDLSLVKPTLLEIITSLKWKTMIILTLGVKGALELFWE